MTSDIRTPVRSEVAEVALRHPAVARAWLADGELHVTGWMTRDDSPGATQADLAQINPLETRFLHDEIFLSQSYLAGGIVLRENAVVFDVGANIGMFSLFAGAVCPSARIFAFEPVPDVFAPLSENIRRHGTPARLFPYGLSDADQDVTFNFYPGISIMSCRSQYADLDNEYDLINGYLSNARAHGPAGRAEHLAQVEALVSKDFELSERRCRLRRLSSVVDELGVDRIDLLKIDVQRAELDVLRGVDDRHWPLIRQISMEVHDEAGTPTEGRVAQVRDLLERHGFRPSVAEEDLLRGTGRYAVQAVHPQYHRDPRPVVAAAGVPLPLTESGLRAFLADRLPADAIPSRIVLPPR